METRARSPLSAKIPQKMKAVVRTEYGSPEVLRWTEIDRPDQSEQGVLVRVRATSVHAGDWHLMRGKPLFLRPMYGGWRRPKIEILGCDIAGEVVAVGEKVTLFQPGDEVFGDLSEVGFGAFAEYVCVPETGLALKPRNLTFAEAGTIPVSALAALQGLRDCGQLQAGQKVLINGASGGVGSFAVQIAKAFGAEVTAMCSAAKMDWAIALGADFAIDRACSASTLKKDCYDLILDTAAYDSIFKDLPALKPEGTYVLVGGLTQKFFQIMLLGGAISKIAGRRVKYLASQPNRKDLIVLKDLLESGKIRPCIERRYSLREVSEAIRCLEERQVRGKIAIAVG